VVNQSLLERRMKPCQPLEVVDPRGLHILLVQVALDDLLRPLLCVVGRGIGVEFLLPPGGGKVTLSPGEPLAREVVRRGPPPSP
jgi:hypothetical protein